jgi:uncharacterized membrane-anchored protein
MSNAQVDRTIDAAIAEGTLPPTATRPIIEDRPWPVTLLIGLGGWLPAVPLLGLIYLKFEKHLEGSGLYVAGLIILTIALLIMHAAKKSIFLQQLGLPTLIAGLILIGIALYRDLAVWQASLSCAAMTVAVAIMTRDNWLQALLGALSCSFLMATFHGLGFNPRFASWLAAHAALVLIPLGFLLCRQMFTSGAGAQAALKVDAIMVGWTVVVLLTMPIWSGSTFLLSQAALLISALTNDQLIEQEFLPVMGITSAILGICAAGWMARALPVLRQGWMVVAALVLGALSWASPSLGAVLMILAACTCSARWRLATLAGLATLWIIGALYYQLSLPLAIKGMGLIAAGAILIVVARSAARTLGTVAIADNTSSIRKFMDKASITLCAVAVLAVVNVGIWQKEEIIRNSRVVFVELAPADPRSLMQGDYMTLNFLLPEVTEPEEELDLDVEAEVPSPADTDSNRKVVATIDERGVATLSRIYAGGALAKGEFLIGLKKRGDDWTMVTDAWHFAEGEATRWERARYGEFRVDSEGRALLVGLRGAKLEEL